MEPLSKRPPAVYSIKPPALPPVSQRWRDRVPAWDLPAKGTLVDSFAPVFGDPRPRPEVYLPLTDTTPWEKHLPASERGKSSKQEADGESQPTSPQSQAAPPPFFSTLDPSAPPPLVPSAPPSDAGEVALSTHWSPPSMAGPQDAKPWSPPVSKSSSPSMERALSAKESSRSSTPAKTRAGPLKSRPLSPPADNSADTKEDTRSFSRHQRSLMLHRRRQVRAHLTRAH